MSVRKMRFLGLTLICVLALAGAVSAQDDGPANQQFEDSELAGMSWDEIVAAADGSEGQLVHVGRIRPHQPFCRRIHRRHHRRRIQHHL